MTVTTPMKFCRRLAMIWLAALALTSVSYADVVAQEVGTLETARELVLTPQTLVLAGLGEWADTILYRIGNAHELRQLLKSKQTAANTALNAVTALAQAVADGVDGSEITAQYDAAVAHFQNAQAQLIQTRRAILEAAIVNLPPASVQLLNTCRANAALAIPAQFGVKHKTMEQWKAIEGALRAEARAQRRDETLHSAHAQLLSTMRADVDVIAASLRLHNQLSSVENVFAQHAE